uniref:Family with sequence similarity 13 member A n=2 Tax=Bos TaxID=9903 RepID=A0AAA9SMS7_BOVIN
MGAGALAICQSKTAVRLKEDMKKIVAVPLHEQRNPTYTKLFGVSLQDLHQQGLTENGVPAIVGSIVEYLTMHGLTQEGLFRVNGNVKVVEQLRWKFESGVPVELGRDGDVCAAASLLKLFLRELPESVITSTLQPRFLQLFQDDRNDAQESNLRALIEELPDTHYCLLKYLCQFLTKVAKHHVQNRMNVHNLATVFGPNCFHVPPGLEGVKEQDLCNKIMAKILENYNTLFEVEYMENDNQRCENLARLIIVKEANCKNILLTKDFERDTLKPSPKTKNMENLNPTPSHERTGSDHVELISDGSKENEKDGRQSQHLENPTMKIQEHPSLPDSKLQRTPDADDQQESFVSEVPELDLTALCDQKSWEEPIPAFSSWQQESVDADEARLSPQAGRLIRQLLEEDSDPMLSPRFYAYGQSRQYLDDTEVPPSPPNSHPFMRRRSSSLGSYEDEQEDLTPAQLTRRIQSLKKKIRKFEDRFEEERKYRPSHSDKAANPEVLKWTNDLAKFRKQLKESKLKISEEDLPPRMRQRSNTLPKSFGSQLEKEDEKKQELVDKAIKPSVEATLESIQRKLQEKRAETSRPEDIKDMTKDQIANEKVALQKALLYYESIHGRPVSKNERQVMKPLYDRYRLVKQILSRASTIPIIGSPSSKRRSPLLQPIIEGETASFFKEIKEEEEGSEDDNYTKPDFMVTLKTDFSARCFLDQFEDDADGFISPMDDKIPSKCSQDTGLSNLHAASIPELLEHLQEMREEKKRIRKKLRDFEDNFFRQNGRNVQKEDRTPMAEEYNEYKHIKAKLRLLEVLISKRDTDSKSM